jgi:hypothetical protein
MALREHCFDFGIHILEGLISSSFNTCFPHLEIFILALQLREAGKRDLHWHGL